MTATRGFVTASAMTALDARLADAGRVVTNNDNTVRTGVLGSLNYPLVVPSGAAMNMQVYAAVFVGSKSAADGAILFANDGPYIVSLTAAPVSNSRIDVIWAKHQDTATGDGASTPIISKTDGTASASPVKPAIPTGAIELATIRVYSGTTVASGGSNVTTQTYQMTAATGGLVPFRSTGDLSLWTTAQTGQGAVDISTGITYTWTGSGWSSVSGTFIARPSAVTGGTADTTAMVTFSGVTTVRLDGIFSPAFRFYEVYFDITVASSQNVNMNMCSGGTPINSASAYGYSRVWTSSTSTLTAQNGTTSTAFSLSGLAATRHTGRLVLSSPADAVTATALIGQMFSGGQHSEIAGSRQAATSEDGLQISSSANISGWVKVVGIA